MLTKKRIRKIIDIVLEALWLAVIFFVPVFFLRQCHNIFEIPKNILFQILTEILLFFYIIKIILFPTNNRDRWNKIKSFLARLLFLFLFWEFLRFFLKLNGLVFGGLGKEGWVIWLGRIFFFFR